MFKWKVQILKEEFIEMTYDLEVKSMYTFNGIGYYWMKEKTRAKYLKLCAAIEPILLAFPCLYIRMNLGLAICIIY